VVWVIEGVVRKVVQEVPRECDTGHVHTMRGSSSCCRVVTRALLGIPAHQGVTGVC